MDKPSYIPYDPQLTDKAKDLRKNMTQPEKKLWFDYLRSTPYKFLRQKPLDKFIVDFYCADKMLVIEIDGDSHYTDGAEKYDQNRTKILEKYGLKVLRFTNREVMNNFEAVCEEIDKWLNVAAAS